MVTQAIDSPFYGATLRGIEDEPDPAGYSPLFVSGHCVGADPTRTTWSSPATTSSARWHVFMAEAAWRMLPQVSSNLFLHDIPVTYNASTPGSFGNRFSLLTLGVRADF